MSNHLAIATVTATLRSQLQGAVQTALPGATVTTLRPDKSEAGETANPTVNLYLYQVSPNAAWRNEDLPTRDGTGRLDRKPRAALDLHYLLSFYGDEGELAPQRLLGVVVQTLHARPVLSRDAIQAVVGITPYLKEPKSSDLAQDVETVKFTPLPLNLEELSKLWSVFFQTPYVLSVAYQAGVVLIEGEEAPSRPLPVRERRIHLAPFRHARLEQVRAAGGHSGAATFGEGLVLRGRGLAGPGARVDIGGTEVAPDTVSDREVRVTLDHPALRAGIHSVRLVYGQDRFERYESNALPLMLRPRIVASAVETVEGGAQELRITLQPELDSGQKLRAYLNGTDASQAYVLAAEPTTGDVASFSIGGVVPGDYLVRIEVDGAESLLEFDEATGRYSSPTVNI